MVLNTSLMTVEEFEAFADSPENVDRRLELIDGIIVEKEMPTQVHGIVAGNFQGFIWVYMREHGLGRVHPEVRFRAADNSPNSRIPDISVSLSDDPIVEEGSVVSMPDIAIEVASPEDKLHELRTKIRYYLANGTRVGILALPRKRIIEVYREGEELVLTEEDTLSLDDVLPNFSVPVRELFADLKKPKRPSED